MKRSRFSEEQIISILREHEAGAKSHPLAALDEVLGGDAPAVQGD